MNNNSINWLVNGVYLLIFIFVFYFMMQLHFLQVSNGDAILENNHKIHFNGAQDENWAITRNTGIGATVTSNALQFLYAGSPNEGLTMQNGNTVQFEILGSNGAITFDKAYTFPTFHGTMNEVLTDNGRGNLTWLPGQMLLDTFVTIYPVAAGSFSLPWGYTGLIFVGAGTTNVFTLVLPPSPVEGQTVLLKSNGTAEIKTLIFNGNGYPLSPLLEKGISIGANTTGIALNFHRGKWY
jgi:hypothetical protein